MWGLESQPVPLSVAECINVLLRREELEYTLPGEDAPYEAAKINRFRLVWQVLHLLHSFWRVTETTKSVHTYLKTPGAFGLARNVLDVTPEMIEQYILQGHPLCTASKRTKTHLSCCAKQCPLCTKQLRALWDRMATAGCSSKKALLTRSASGQRLFS